VDLNAPNGAKGTVPIDKVHDAIKAGFSPFEPTEAQAAASPPSEPTPNVNMETSAAPKVIHAVTGTLPAVGGLGGGALSGVAGLPSGPGAIATASAGVGLGTAVGEQARLIANHILFANEPAPESKEGLESTAIQGGTAAATTGILGTAGYLATKTPTPNYDQTPDDWRAINDALGVKAKQVSIPKGADDIGDAYRMPGRSVAEKTGITADEFNEMTPFEQASKIAPAWKQAGQQVTEIADAATQKGVTFDMDKPVSNAINLLPTPQMQERAFNITNDVADTLGVKDWKAATPNEALALRRALWDGLPGGFRAPVYGAITGSLKTAVPEIVPADQTYSELSAAIEATKNASQKFAISPPAPSAFMQAAKKAAPYIIAGAAGAGTASAFRALSDVFGGSR
jgi:hypothetical protein